MNTAPLVIQVAVPSAGGSNSRSSDAVGAGPSAGKSAFDGAMKAVGSRPTRKSAAAKSSDDGSAGAALPAPGNTAPPVPQAVPHAVSDKAAADTGSDEQHRTGVVAARPTATTAQAGAVTGDSRDPAKTAIPAAGVATDQAPVAPASQQLALAGGTFSGASATVALGAGRAESAAASPVAVGASVAPLAAAGAQRLPMAPAGAPTDSAIASASALESASASAAAAAASGAASVAHDQAAEAVPASVEAANKPVADKADGKIHGPASKMAAKLGLHNAAAARTPDAAASGGDDPETESTQSAAPTSVSAVAAPATGGMSPIDTAAAANTVAANAAAVAGAATPANSDESFDSDAAVGLVGARAATFASAPAPLANDADAAGDSSKVLAENSPPRIAVPAVIDAAKPLHVAGATVPGGVDAASFAVPSAPAAVPQPDSVAPAVALRVHASVDSTEFAQGLSERVSWMVDNGINGAKLQVNPPQLGPIELRIAVQGDHAQVWMTTHSAVAREALESGSPALRDMLGAHGFGQVSVDISQRSFQERPAYTPPYERESTGSRNSVSATAAVAAVASPRASLGALDAYA